MTLLDAQQYDPTKARRRKMAITAAIVALLIAAGIIAARRGDRPSGPGIEIALIADRRHACAQIDLLPQKATVMVDLPLFVED